MQQKQRNFIIRSNSALHHNQNSYMGCSSGTTLTNFNVKQKENTIKSKCKSFILMDAETQQILAKKNPKQSLEIASLTKMVTLQVSLKICEDLGLNDQFVVQTTQNAASIKGTSAMLQPGDYLTLDELYYGLMLPSGNDASKVIGENMGVLIYLYDKYVRPFAGDNSNQLNGFKLQQDQKKEKKVKEILENARKTSEFQINLYSESLKQMGYLYFIKQMNKYMRELKLLDTYFSNTHGMSVNENYSTAYDMAIVTYNIMQNEYIQKIVSTKNMRIQIYNPHYGEREILWINTNKLIQKDWAGYRGVKTGINRNAGGCLSSYFEKYDSNKRKQYNLILIVLGSKNAEGRFSDTEDILTQYFESEDSYLY